MRLEPGVGLADDCGGIGVVLQRQHGVDKFGMIRTAPMTAASRTPAVASSAFDIFGKHLQTLSRGDDILLPALNHQVPR